MSTITAPNGIGSAYAALMGTVATSANATSSIINAAASSVSMLETFINKAAADQKERYAEEAYETRKTRKVATAQRIAEMEIKSLEFCDKSPVHKDFFAKALAELEALHKPVQP